MSGMEEDGRMSTAAQVNVQSIQICYNLQSPLWRHQKQRCLPVGCFTKVVFEPPTPLLRSTFPTTTNPIQQKQQEHHHHRQVRQFWWRGGHSHEKSVVNTDLSKMRPYPSTILNYPVSVCSVQGHRDYMEDEFAIHSDFAACFDGHGGKAVSCYLRQNLYANLQAVLPEMIAMRIAREEQQAMSNDSNVTATITKTATVEDYVAALEVALDKVDREILKIHHWSYQGSTALLCWIHTEEVISSHNGDDDDNSDVRQQIRTLITSNIGDGRAVLCRNGAVIALSRDHKPEDPIEIRRIQKLGGKVVWVGRVDQFKKPIPGMGLWRVNGCLSLTRVIGDRSERPAVTSDPEITILQLEEYDEFIIMATDGLWDVMSSSDAVAFVRTLIQNSSDVGSIDRDAMTALLIEEALRRGSYDNITAIIIWLS
jgi:serine/threonine protein phosphatase PrpC